MLPLVIEGFNVIFKDKKPGSKMHDIHAVVTEDNVTISRWQPTPEEVQMLLSGGSVELRMIGPPTRMLLTVADKVVIETPSPYPTLERPA